MQIDDLELPRVRRLAALRPEGAKVTSVYVDLDPARFATAPARASEITSLLTDAERTVRDIDADQETRASLRRDVDAVREFLVGDGFPAEGAHGLAVFCSSAGGVFDVLRLPEPVDPAVVIDDRPWLEPLLGHERDTRCLALVSRRCLRVLLDGPDGRLVERVEETAEVHGRHEQGGWSQANYERSIENDVHAHLKRSAATLAGLARRSAFDVLAIGATAELYGVLTDMLGKPVRDALVGRFAIDVEQATPDDALQAASSLLADAQARRLDGLLDRLRAGVGRGQGAVAGLRPTLDALNERRVDTLLHKPDLTAPGVACGHCGWLGAEGERCPACDAQLSRRANVVEDAIAAALLQSTTVRSVGDRPDLDPIGGIGAVLRF